MNLKNLKVIFLFLILFFVLDKLLLLSYVQNCCVKKDVSFFFLDSLENRFDEGKWNQTKNHTDVKLVFNFGSSLSYGYHYFKRFEDLGEKSHSHFVQKKKQEYEMYNFGYPGASLVTSCVRMNQMLDRGLRPEFIAIELAPSVLNSKTPWHQKEILHSIPLSFVFSQFSEIPWKHSFRILTSRMVQLSRFSLGNSQQINLLQVAFEKFMVTEDKDMIPPQGYRLGQESKEDLLNNQFFNYVLGQLLTNYKIDPEIKYYLKLIVDRAKKENIPLVFWFPKLHPESLRVVKEKVDVKEWNDLISNLKDKNIHYIDLNEESSFVCDTFVDSMHMDLSCFPKAFSHKTKLIYSNE